jgi:hypothetical protein
MLGAVLASAVIGVDIPARAQSTTTLSSYSPYEKVSLDRALAATRTAIDPQPEGKTIEAVDVVSLEVIEDRDPAPSFLNMFHATTRASVVKKVLTVRSGDRFEQYRVDESVRVLRSFQQLSLVIAVATRGSHERAVRLLVVTKDVWSLRSQLDVRLGSGGLDLLRIEPTERNVGGTLDSIISRFELYPETLTLGGAYIVPRLVGQRLYFYAEGNVIVNRDSGAVEGSFGDTFISVPQVTASQSWVWGTGLSWRNEFVRRYVGAKQITFDAPGTPELEQIPDQYRSRRLTESVTIGRSYGLAYKTDVSFGAELNVRHYVGLDPTREGARVVADYRAARVPTSDTRVGPWVQLRAYESRFIRIRDYDTLALQEDYRVGYDAWARVFPITRALGSSRDFVGFDVAAQYILPVGDGFLRATGESVVELAPSEIPSAAFYASGGFVSPRFFLGRFVVDAFVLDRARNYLNVRTPLGGESRLRGFPSATLLGQNVVAYNAELRTRPIEILACQLGGAFFYDVADAFDTWPARPKSSAGAGIRALFPQLDRKVFRIDVGFPLVRTGGEGPVGFYVAFEQAFPPLLAGPPGAGPSQAVLTAKGGALGQ